MFEICVRAHGSLLLTDFNILLFHTFFIVINDAAADIMGGRPSHRTNILNKNCYDHVSWESLRRFQIFWGNPHAKRDTKNVGNNNDEYILFLGIVGRTRRMTVNPSVGCVVWRNEKLLIVCVSLRNACFDPIRAVGPRSTLNNTVYKSFTVEWQVLDSRRYCTNTYNISMFW